jgi:hypothetical protein
MGKRGEGALKSALDGYGFAGAPEDAIARMMQAETETLILHELGECEVGRRLGPHWEDLIGRLTRRRSELFVRALRDHLADCLVTLPALLERDAGASVHFWFANLHGMRQALFPRLTAAYASWCEGDGGVALRSAIDAGVPHWQLLCAQLLELPAEGGDSAEDEIEALSSASTTLL